MAEVNIKITATVQQLSDFADELGYMEFTPSYDPESGTVLVPNPETRQAYLQEYFKRITVEELAKVQVKAIDNEVRNQRDADKQAIRDNISNAVAVTFKV